MLKQSSTLAVLATLGLASSAHASGFFLQEAAYANLGTAGAGDGVYTDSSAAIWTNPAVMSHMDSELTTISGTLLNLDIDYYDEAGNHNTNTNSTLPVVSFFHVEQLNEDLKLGLAFSSPGGATLDYGSDWDGASQLTDVALLTYQFNPSLSYKINDQWSVAAGAQINYAFLQGNTSVLELDTATDWAFGYNLGVMYQATEKLRLGLSYRSELNHEFESDLYAGENQRNYSTELPAAAISDLSASYQLTDKLALLASVQQHHWSSMEETRIDISGGSGGPFPYTIDREWDDVWKFAGGAEYQLTSSWSVKAGYSYETSPLDDPANQSPDLPVGEQHRYSIGVSKQFEDSRLDVYYQYSDFGEMDIEQTAKGGILRPSLELDGHFTGAVHFIGASYTY
ncbi:OmpP1/FadL family transporter [Vibrio maerlii]|uniref:OmpP1/FadL family transporter n=1 Tax=Vibrio maerlii TaxID=2231648 RepID=UPI000E3E8609|nr:outer membrane protein transport protein [Vibrio maerlii]